MMNEEKMRSPLLTKEELVKELRLLGLSRGMLLLVEADSDRLPYLVGGEQALVNALMEVVGYEGTIVCASFTPELLDPACIPECPFPYESWEEIRCNALPYQPKLSLPKYSDPFVRQFLRNDGIVRSYHPLYSFAAWGKYAKVICRRHPLHFGLNEESPLGRICDLNGYVLLLGTSFEKACIHALAQYRSRRAADLHSPPSGRKKHIFAVERCAGLPFGPFPDQCRAGDDGRPPNDFLFLSGQCAHYTIFRT